jgi:hypothetical protein
MSVYVCTLASEGLTCALLSTPTCVCTCGRCKFAMTTLALSCPPPFSLSFSAMTSLSLSHTSLLPLLLSCSLSRSRSRSRAHSYSLTRSFCLSLSLLGCLLFSLQILRVRCSDFLVMLKVCTGSRYHQRPVSRYLVLHRTVRVKNDVLGAYP